MDFPIPLGLPFVFAMYAGIGLLMWYGGRKRDGDIPLDDAAR